MVESCVDQAGDRGAFTELVKKGNKIMRSCRQTSRQRSRLVYRKNYPSFRTLIQSRRWGQGSVFFSPTPSLSDAKIKDLQAKEVHEEYDRKNTEQVAKRVVREAAARKQLQIEAQKDKAKRAEESRCAASAVGGEDGAGSGGGTGGDAEAADAEGAAELEQATVAGQLAQDQLSALDALERMFQ